ncbi:PREDICTED: uncharacterized protein LOC108752390 [Trachymyrmex septentrionalis]|uniref:uncharacterized protein LOC108752390 n=1 Tax=Trachymyrmex septentrionalis TaxID=34720 RepID=UPI00084F6A13|nr:PREDICTED: uncharacterized protein LOC108752390 [Trachymyrmex septentrionalis]
MAPPYNTSWVQVHCVLQQSRTCCLRFNCHAHKRSAELAFNLRGFGGVQRTIPDRNPEQTRSDEITSHAQLSPRSERHESVLRMIANLTCLSDDSVIYDPRDRRINTRTRTYMHACTEYDVEHMLTEKARYT